MFYNKNGSYAHHYFSKDGSPRYQAAFTGSMVGLVVLMIILEYGLFPFGILSILGFIAVLRALGKTRRRAMSPTIPPPTFELGPGPAKDFGKFLAKIGSISGLPVPIVKRMSLIVGIIFLVACPLPAFVAGIAFGSLSITAFLAFIGITTLLALTKM